VKRSTTFEIFSASLAAILLEVAYTRVFSFKVYYYFTYLIIGTALMGLGAGAVALTTVRRMGDAEPRRVVAGASIAGAATVLAGYWVAATTQLNASALSSNAMEVFKLVGVSALVTVPFVCIGIVVATILSRAGEQVGRLYAADLLGAGVGCAVSIPLLTLLDPPRVIVLAGALLAAAGIRAATSSFWRAVGAFVALVHVAPVASSTILPDPIVDRLKGFENFRGAGMIRTTRWDPVFRVDVADHPTETGNLFLLFHDGSPGSGMRRLDPGKTAFSHLDADSRRLPFEVLVGAPRVLVIGSAGGHEVVASLHFGASHVTGVELNSSTLDLLDGEYGDISGHLRSDPRVTLVNGDGRWFLSQSEEEFDLIWFVAPDSYAAMNASTSGAYVLAESYLYTVETLQEAIKHLHPQGIICAQFGEFDYDQKPNRTVRFIATARHAFYLGRTPDLDERVLVSTAPGLPPFVESTVILGRRSFTNEQMDAFEGHVERRIAGGKVQYSPRRIHDESPVNRVTIIPQDLIGDWYREYPYLVGPVRDESPFFWHFARFEDTLTGGAPREGPIDFEDALGERVLFVLLGVALVLGVAFLVLPLFVIRRDLAKVDKLGTAAIYFTCLGIGFMFVEVTLIQKLTLLLGYPTRSLTVTLLSLLVSSGAGSYLTTRFRVPWATALGRLMAALVILLSVWFFVTPHLVDVFVGAALPVRVLVSICLTAPIGLCLGCFLPVGMSAVTEGAESAREIVAWSWAVNAFASVVASILAAILAMAVGFKLLLLIAPVLYATGAMALLRIAPLTNAEGPGT
jgi:hypothetical protein